LGDDGAQPGNLDPAELATASTKLAGWGYSFTTPSVETLMRAGSVAVWNPDQFPLKQALDQFAADTMTISDTFRLGAELIVRLYNDAYLRGQRRTVTSRLLDRLATRAGGREAIEMLPRSGRSMPKMERASSVRPAPRRPARSPPQPPCTQAGYAGRVLAVPRTALAAPRVSDLRHV